MVIPGDPKVFLRDIINPSCDLLFDMSKRPAMVSREAKVQMLAMAMQETRLGTRLQLGDNGTYLRKYGRGFWQFESGGGIKGVMNHAASKTLAMAICNLFLIPWKQSDIHEAVAYHDLLAGCFARLLLWTDPQPLPAMDQKDYAWNYYIRLWNPGKPHIKTWSGNYQIAQATVFKQLDNSEPVLVA